jgi:hypoxanthine phosphoribosyltransferase
MRIAIKNKNFEVFLQKSTIQERIQEIGNKISCDFEEKELVVIGVLNGSFVFMADLCRAIDLPITCTFIKITSYLGTATTGQVRSVIGLDQDLKGKIVLIVEDIVDTGISMDFLLKTISEHDPARIVICTLLFKPEAFRFKYALDYVCFEIPNKFVVGYGLDYDGLGRNLPEIYQLDTP